MRRLTHAFAILLLNSINLSAAPDEDRVRSFPGLETVPDFGVYSGYLDATPAHHLHYVFTEARLPQPDTPLLVWFNGGPGCSSMLGLFTENGPFRIKPDHTKPGPILSEFAQSWTTVAHMLFIESPVGVGYSYSDTFDADVISDENTAIDAHKALQQFFKKFPGHAQRKFALSGESYGGIYVPMLGVKVDSDIDMTERFIGVMIGNGFLNAQMDRDSTPFYLYYHGLIGFTEWRAMVDKCCNRVADRDHCDFGGFCRAENERVQREVWQNGYYPYNLYAKCLKPHQEVAMMQHKNILATDFLDSPDYDDAPDPCEDDFAVDSYISSIRHELHTANHFPTQRNWHQCSKSVIGKYQSTVFDTSPHIQEILSRGNRTVMFYSGDVDMACNFLGTQWFVTDLVKSLGYKESDGYRQWHIDDQVAGYSQNWWAENNSGSVMLRTVRGAGHMVPTDKPVEALQLIKDFLKATARGHHNSH